jgi:hypothetical protein
MNQRNARGTAEIAEHLTYKVVQFIHVEIGHDRLLLRGSGSYECSTALLDLGRV